MPAIGCPDRHVVGRKDKVVIVNFRGPEPPAPYFPGAGAMRVAVLAGDEMLDGSSEQHDVQQQRFIA
jgi:hypothetical protein